jgi:serpin B
MKIELSKNRLVLAGALAMTLLSCGDNHAASAGSLPQANNDFGFDFYKQAGAKAGNVVFSPYSISAAFAMTYAGAAGDTATQMLTVMHWTNTASGVASDFAALEQLLTDAQRSGAVQISIANSLWPQKGYGFRRDYLDLLSKTFKTSLREADFQKQPEVERRRINQWVEQQTKDRIKDLMPPGSVSEATRLVLANAIYFKAKWQEPFKTNATRPAPFHLASGGSVSTPLMAKTSSFRYALMPDFKLLELPYQGGELSMLVVLPDETNGLPQLERELSNAKLDAWMRALRIKQVSVFLPRFQMTFQTELNQALAALGMRYAFSSEKADFTGMTGKRDLYISRAIHKAFVEVNEEGTEAAAATGIAMAPTSAVRPVEVAVFRADHPFLYLIRHNATGTILFLGRLSAPAKAG